MKMTPMSARGRAREVGCRGEAPGESRAAALGKGSKAGAWLAGARRRKRGMGNAESLAGTLGDLL